MNEMRDSRLKKATDFINSGRALGVSDTHLLSCIISSELTKEQFDAFIAWFHVQNEH